MGRRPAWGREGRGAEEQKPLIPGMLHLKIPPGNAPMGATHPMALCRDITSATAKPLTRCWSSTRLLRVKEGEACRDPTPALDWHPSPCHGWKKNQI